MDNEYINELNLDPAHRFEQTQMRSEQRRGRDTDFYTYREYDAQGEFVREFTVEDSTSIFPPQKRTIRIV